MGDLGWGGVGLGSWGWAFSFLCFGIVECAHGHAYAKQVRIMCVLSVPLLDQVRSTPRPLELKLLSVLSVIPHRPDASRTGFPPKPLLPQTYVCPLRG